MLISDCSCQANLLQEVGIKTETASLLPSIWTRDKLSTPGNNTECRDLPFSLSQIITVCKSLKTSWKHCPHALTLSRLLDTFHCLLLQYMSTCSKHNLKVQCSFQNRQNCYNCVEKIYFRNTVLQQRNRIPKHPGADTGVNGTEPNPHPPSTPQPASFCGN